MKKPLYKTTLVIWTDYDPVNVEIDDLAFEAVRGDAYCSISTKVLVPDPEEDKDWDGTEFFDSDDDCDIEEEENV